jgi:hypothetical protein
MDEIKKDMAFLFNHFFHNSATYAGKDEGTTGSIPA